MGLGVWIEMHLGLHLGFMPAGLEPDAHVVVRISPSRAHLVHSNPDFGLPPACPR